MTVLSTLGFLLSLLTAPSAWPLSGSGTVVYSEVKPAEALSENLGEGPGEELPFSAYTLLTKKIRQAYSPVALSKAGKLISYSRENAAFDEKTCRVFYSDSLFSIEENWSLNEFGDMVVEQTLTALQPGWFSILSPEVRQFDRSSFKWAAVPGYVHSNWFNPDFDRAYNYGIGIPDVPVVYRERTATTLTAMVTDGSGRTVAVTAAPGQGRDPWEYDSNTTDRWRLGLSLLRPDGSFCPTICKPVLGEEGSFLEPGQKAVLKTIVSVVDGDWYRAYSHIVEDIYALHGNLALKTTSLSLSERLLMLGNYLLDAKTSLWRSVEAEGKEIGAQDYLGAVYGSDHDAMKNADYGTMWMLSGINPDAKVMEGRLPAALNFKYFQQVPSGGKNSGAPKGQYYLYKSGRFTEEWGDYTEPVANSYYMLSDLGNISLFEPHNKEVRKRIRLAADRLLGWMDENGRFAVAYDNLTGKELFTDIPDLRPTFYGLVVAYKVLGDRKYLSAARKGADWLRRNAVDRGQFLGVCGDTRFSPDFATAQCSQAYLDLYELTGEEAYRETGYEIGRIYTNNVYTHPLPEGKMKLAGKKVRELRTDAEISQIGLNFEHGGTFGSATFAGPILLSSHAGMFVRQAAATSDTLLLDMARLAATGRDAFVNMQTGVASYYWNAMNNGSGPFPHHAWWQIGWIMDYLLSEASLRSGGAISFPSGFYTPKVGPHKPYGFAPGKIYGKKAQLILQDGLVDTGNPYIDYITAAGGNSLYVILLNDSDRQQSYDSLVGGERKTGEIAPWGIELITIKRNRK